MLRISGVEPESIVDGPGFRYAIFAQGCPHDCAGCHNQQTHPFDGGRELTDEEVLQAFSENPLLAGVTFSGGEPFCQAVEFAQLAEKIHALGKDVVTYTGYEYEQLCSMKADGVQELLIQTDILIDGPYLEEDRDLTLRFRGSRNQRVLNLVNGRIVD